MANHPKRKHGFTLVELMVVIGILAALGTVALPAITKTIPNYQLRAASRELVIQFKKSKLEAVKRGREVLIEFTPETVGDPHASGSYRTFVDMDESDGWNSGDLLLSTINLPSNVRLSSAPTTPLGYNSRGLPATPWGTVTLKNKDGTKIYEISLSAAGSVRLASL